LDKNLIEKIYLQNRLTFIILIDLSILIISYIVAVLLRFDFKIPNVGYNTFNWIPIITSIQIILFYSSGFYKSIWRFTSLLEIYHLIKYNFITISVSALIIFSISSFEGYPRSILIIFYFINTASLCSSRMVIRVYFSHFSPIKKVAKNKVVKKKIILIGAGKTGEKITREIINSHDVGYQVVGFVDDKFDRIGRRIHGYMVLGNIASLENMDLSYDELLITMPSATGDQMRVIVDICKRTGKRFKIVPSLIEMIDKDITLDVIRDVSYGDLLGRDEIILDINSIENFLKGKRILISGAGGSIGSELLKQCLLFNPAEIICVDSNEESIFIIGEMYKNLRKRTIIKPVLANILDENEVLKVFNENRPQIIFHAAAYKHVPIQEIHPWTAVNVNVGGTKIIAEAANNHNAEKFVLVSTDKAVNPVNIMGATKRLSEKLILSLNKVSKTKFIAVRFGNVLGSSGSAIPTFQKQIKNGGPVTITHPEMTRYFMSIPEAAQLILQAGSFTKSDGNIFLLEMGKPIKIDRMARDLIKLSGYEPEVDIPVVYTGLRPGEKLYEELQNTGEHIVKTNHNKIMILKDGKREIDWVSLQNRISNLIKVSKNLDNDAIQENLKDLIPTYKPRTYENFNINPKVSSYSIKGEA
jgi:FlaA1/EpsC-like NDP-sugar epimerase